MAKINWPGAPLLAPVPAVLVTCGTMEKANIATVAWTGIVNSDPPMTYISLRPSRHSHSIISQTGEFVINLTTSGLAKATDACGIYTGAKMDKIKAYSLTAEPATQLACPTLKQSPVSLECKVTEIKHLGSHDLFLARIVAVDVEESLLDDKGKLDLRRCNLMAYSHGDYLQLGKKVGHFGFSVKKKKKGK